MVETDMETRKDVANQQPGSVERRPREEEPALRPPVDIFEDENGITVQAEMPGVSKDQLIVQADRNNLLIEGEMAIDMPTGMEAMYADVQSTRYARSFALSTELDAERIEANLKDGVLTVRIPKRTEHRARRIEVRTD